MIVFLVGKECHFPLYFLYPYFSETFHESYQVHSYRFTVMEREHLTTHFRILSSLVCYHQTMYVLLITRRLSYSIIFLMY